LIWSGPILNPGENIMVSFNKRRVSEEIASMVEETTAAMKSNAEAASDMERIAGELTRLVSRFRC
jgi:methyl-accepting chemotaxis protein